MKTSNAHAALARGIAAAALAGLAAWAAPAAGAVTNQVDSTNRFAWSENAGWNNWRASHAEVKAVRDGANGYLSGYAWGENIGWIKVGDGNGPYANTGSNNYGVNMDAAGRLSGFAWSETCGWINFSNTCDGAAIQVTASTNTGAFDGYAWGANIGWIHFKNESPAYNVRMFQMADEVTLTNLNQYYNGAPRVVGAATVPEGLPVDITYNGLGSAPVNAGTYAVTGTVNHALYRGSATGTLTVNKGDQFITNFPGSDQVATNTVRLWAQASSGLSVTEFEVIAGPGAISGMTNLTFSGAGTVNVAARQSGDGNWNPAPAVTAAFDVVKALASVTLGSLSQVYDGTPRIATAETVPAGLPVNITYNGAGAAPVNGGSYAVTGCVADAMYQGEAAGTLTIAKAAASVTLQNLSQTYNGMARVVTAATVPAGLAVEMTYDGHAWAPTNPGAYAVTGAVADTNYQGAAGGTLSITFTPTAGKGGYADKTLVYWDSIPAASGFRVWRGNSPSAQEAAVIASCQVPYYMDTSPSPGVLYYYWIQPIYPSGTGELSLPDAGYCGSIDSLPAPAGVAASQGTYPDRIRVSWQAVSGATRYEVWRNTSDDLSTAARAGLSDGVSLDDLAAESGIYYYYWVKAGSAIKSGEFSAPGRGWRRMGAAVVTASDGLYPYRVRVDWTAVANATRYEIWRSEVPGQYSAGTDPVMIAGTGGLSFDDYGTRNGVYYRYSVKAFNDNFSAADYGSDTGFRTVRTASTASSAQNDYDGDMLSDLALYDYSTGVLDVLCSGQGRLTFNPGAGDSLAVAGDYDGDRKADPVAYNAGGAAWLAMLSSTGYAPVYRAVFGGADCVPASADFDGDGLADPTIYDDAAGVLSVMFSNGGAFNTTASCAMGGAGCRFVSADFDGDAKADPAVYSESGGLLTALFSGSGYCAASARLGGPGCQMSAADFDGDRKADPVWYETTGGAWTVLFSGANYAGAGIVFGGAGYSQAAGDYDGDGFDDPAVYREADGLWLIMRSGSGYAVIAETFGGPGYRPVTRTP